jgi:hypothetical protein
VLAEKMFSKIRCSVFEHRLKVKIILGNFLRCCLSLTKVCRAHLWPGTYFDCVLLAVTGEEPESNVQFDVKCGWSAALCAHAFRSSWWERIRAKLDFVA